MRNFRIYLFLAFVAFMSAFIYSCAEESTTESQQYQNFTKDQLNELQKQLGVDENTENSYALAGADCGNTTQGCLLLQAAKKDTVLIPGTNCYAEATYDLYRCITSTSGNYIITHVFNNFSATPIPSVGCDSIINSWVALADAGNFSELSNQLDIFHSIVSEQIEIKYNQAFFNNTFFRTYFNCNSFNTLLFSEFYVSNCYQWCFKYIIRDGKPQIDYRKTSCGESCCKRTTAYCWSTSQNMMISSNPNVVQIGTCVADNPGSPCQAGYIALGNCNHTCFPKK